MIHASDFKRGLCIKYNGDPMMIVDVQYSTPTARGGNTLAKTKLRHLETNKLLSETFKASDRFEEVDLERRPCSFLYKDVERWFFMDSESFDQFDFTKEDLGDLTGYIIEGLEGIRAVQIDGRIVGVELPAAVDLVVTQTDPALKGATAQAQLKPATLETGIIVQVPPYLSTGEKVRIDTRDGRFLERVKG